VVEVVAPKITGLNPQVVGTLCNIGIFYIIYDAGHLDIIAMGKIFGYLLGIGPVAGT
jgi:hypothetical protein